MCFIEYFIIHNHLSIFDHLNIFNQLNVDSVEQNHIYVFLRKCIFSENNYVKGAIDNIHQMLFECDKLLWIGQDMVIAVITTFTNQFSKCNLD